MKQAATDEGGDLYGFLNGIDITGFGATGLQDKRRAGPPPDSRAVVTEPAGFDHLFDLRGAGEAADEFYVWLGISYEN